MKARLYLLEGTYPSKVIIKNNLITKEYPIKTHKNLLTTLITYLKLIIILTQQ